MCSPPCAPRRHARSPADPARDGPASSCRTRRDRRRRRRLPGARHPARAKPGIRSAGLHRARFRRPRAAGHAANGFETPGTAPKRRQREAAGPVVSEAG